MTNKMDDPCDHAKHNRGPQMVRWTVHIPLHPRAGIFWMCVLPQNKNPRPRALRHSSGVQFRLDFSFFSEAYLPLCSGAQQYPLSACAWRKTRSSRNWPTLRAWRAQAPIPEQNPATRHCRPKTSRKCRIRDSSPRPGWRIGISFSELATVPPERGRVYTFWRQDARNAPLANRKRSCHTPGMDARSTK
jgi:hypothetical protein